MTTLNIHLLRKEALRLGFEVCGIARTHPVESQVSEAFYRWVEYGKQAGMEYMTRYSEQRMNPTALLPNCRSIICVAMNYYPIQRIDEKEYQLAYYAYGRDYHDLMKERLYKLFQFIQVHYPEANGRICCDTAPLLERYWAVEAGLGWIGKNTQLILPQLGSYFFLGELLLDITFEDADYGVPHKNHCGTCHRCLDACPTGALEAPHCLNANHCLSYLTIEHRGEFPENISSLQQNRIYGCDSCAQACPWNRFARPSSEESLQASKLLLSMRKDNWHQLSREEYQLLFKGSAVKRAKWEGLMRNIHSAQKESETSTSK